MASSNEINDNSPKMKDNQIYIRDISFELKSPVSLSQDAATVKKDEEKMVNPTIAVEIIPPESRWKIYKAKMFDSRINWKFSVFIICVCCFFENLVMGGTATVVLSTIEKEFFLTSAKSGFFLGIYEIGGFLAAPVYGFLGSFKSVNKMRVISVSLLLIALGSYVIGLTVFIKDPYLGFIKEIIDEEFSNSTQNNLNLCLTKNSSITPRLFRFYSDDSKPDECKHVDGASDESAKQLGFLIYIGHLIIGFGSSAIYSIGIAYIEEITEPNQSSYCQAILYGAGSIGGGLGFLLTGQFLNLNARFYLESYEPNKWITPKNTYWIGAWWMPYLVYGSISAILFIISFLFSFVAYQKLSTNLSTDTTSNQPNRTAEKSEFFNKTKIFLKEFWRKTRLVIFNFKFMFTVFSTVTEGVIIKGFIGFMSKYIEYQFDMPASISTVLTGAIALVAVIIGTILSAYIMNKYKFDTKRNSLFSFVMFFISSFFFLMLLNYCPQSLFANNIEGYEAPGCPCNNRFNPVCLPKDILVIKGSSNEYQSPCHAGCSRQLTENRFTNCSYILFEGDHVAENLTISYDNCDQSIKCIDKLLLSGFGALIIVFLTSMSIVPQLKSSIGCFDENMQSFALGIRSGIVGILGNFTGTILIGQAVDLTCQYWQENCYGQRVCKIYHNDKMSLALSLIGFGFRFLSALFMLGAYLVIVYEDREKLAKKQVELKTMPQEDTNTGGSTS